MKNILKISFLSLITLIFFASCDENQPEYTEIDIPKTIIEAVSGPDVVVGNGDTEYTYNVTQRVDATYEWSVSGDGTITPVSGQEFKAVFVANQREDTTAVTVSVVETYKGKSSDPGTYTVQINPFCPYEMTPFEGDYTGTSEASHGPVVTMAETSNLNELQVWNLAWFVPNTWGENWVSGDGSCLMDFVCGEQVLIEPQWIGDSDYPDVYGITGSGTFSETTKTIELTYEVFYGWDGSSGTSAGVFNTTLTLQ